MSFIKDFKSFISKGNVLELAIGVVLGTAFGKIVSSLVSDIITPLIGLVLGGIDVKDFKIPLSKDAILNVGIFIQNILDFLIIAFSIFLFVKLLERFKRKEEAKPVAPVPTREEKLLEEIRDLLKK